MRQTRQTVVYASDHNFWVHTYVSLYSLVINNLDVPLDVYIMSEAPSKKFFAYADRLTLIHNDLTVSWVPVESRLFADVPEPSFFTKTSYYRLLVESLLPPNVQVALYLDSDTIVRRPLYELFRLDIDDWVVGAAPNSSLASHRDHAIRLGLPESVPYFNSGVLLINLDRWREAQIEEQCLKYIRENLNERSRLEWADQDVLNTVLVDKWRPFGRSFNFLWWTDDTSLLTDYDAGEEVGGQVPPDGPAIVHYAGLSPRPWQGRCRHPYSADYWHYRMQTPYGGYISYCGSRVNGVIRDQVLPFVRKYTMGNFAVEAAKAIARTVNFRHRRDKTCSSIQPLDNEN